MTAALLTRPALPPVQGTVLAHGYDGRYMLFTRAHCDFDRFPQYWDGGPGMVTTGEWSLSYGTGGIMPGAVLSATNHRTGERVRERFATDEACRRRAFQLGMLAFMVYVKHADRWGVM